MFSKKLLAGCICFTLLLLLVPKCVNAEEITSVNVFQVYDEEMQSGSFSVLACFPGGDIPVSMSKYLECQWKRVNHRFSKLGINFTVVRMLKWVSNDTYETNNELLDEAISAVNFESGMIVAYINDGNGHLTPIRADVLVAWTGQKTPDDNKIGLCYPDLKACILESDDFVIDDNLLQHELSHIFGAPDHENDVDCVMCQTKNFVNILYAEDLTPIYDDQLLPQVNYVWLCGWIPKGYLENGWCEDCKNCIMGNIIVHSSDPPDEPIEQAPLARLVTILLWAGITVGIALTIKEVLEWRKRKKAEQKSNIPLFYL